MIIDDLIPMQDAVRSFLAVEEMRTLACKGHIFSLENLKKHHEWTKILHSAKLISIAKFEDGKLMIRDGHHRVLAIWLAERELHPDEYVIENWLYEDFMEISHQSIAKGFVTPFDPRKEVRIADFQDYKISVPKTWPENREFIFNSWQKKVYSRQREHYHISGLVFEDMKKGCNKC